MSDFDFTAVKTTVTKADDVPQITRTRVAVNPLTDTFLKSTKKIDGDGNGQWLNMVLPGIAKVTDKGAVGYGDVVTKALNYLRAAAKEAGFGLGSRIVDMEDGTVKIHFRAQPRRRVNQSKDHKE